MNKEDLLGKQTNKQTELVVASSAHFPLRDRRGLLGKLPH